MKKQIFSTLLISLHLLSLCADTQEDITVVIEEKKPLLINASTPAPSFLERLRSPERAARLKACLDQTAVYGHQCCYPTTMCLCMCCHYEDHTPLGRLCPDIQPDQREQNVRYCLIGSVSTSIIWAVCMFT